MTCPAEHDRPSSCSPEAPDKVSFIEPDTAVLSQLDNERSKSSIPSRDSCWLYPSQRQFYKSTVSKGHDVDPALIPAIVEIHNVINERAWQQVMEYESLHSGSCKNPVLVHFVGRKDKPTIRSLFNHLIGYKLPYDRHDWTIDRYILDFYEGPAESPEKMGVYIDARPDLSFCGICDRLRLWAHKSFGWASRAAT